MLKFIGVIPARYQSVRFPGKILADIQGKSMLQRVYEQALQAKYLDKIIVAVDDAKVYEHVTKFGGTAVMTDTLHNSGTERCAEAINNYQITDHKDIVIVNIQADEPFINPLVINELCLVFKTKDISIATLASPINDDHDVNNPNMVKVVFDENHHALYFSRYAIPYKRNKAILSEIYIHIGLYAYRCNELMKLVKLPQVMIEQVESLEQLRWIYHRRKIKVVCTPYHTLSIDTPDDLEKAKKLYL